MGQSSKPLPFLQKFEAKRLLQLKMELCDLSKFVIILISLISLGSEIHGEYIPPGPKYKCPSLNQIWPCRCITATDDGITLECTDVSLATLSAAVAYPVGYKIPVNYLHIRKLNTEKLYGTIFDNLNATKIRIEDSPLKEIYSDVFYITRDTLKELELINTNLDEFPVDALQDLINLETLTIDKHRINSLTKPITGLGALKNLRISNGNISEFYKDTFAALGAKLVRLDLHGNYLKSVPKDAFQNLKNLEYFDVAYNQFDKLDPTYFVHLNKLTWFNGSNNLIPDFRRGAFARNGFLRVIYLNHNKITKIDAAAFRGMRLLVRLYLADNQISDVGRAAFNSLQRIKTIDLSRNKLKFIDFQMFLKLPFCEEIFLQENQITRIKSGAFNELAYIQINMSHNQISGIEKESFVNCVNITILDMSHNLIDNFTKGAFDENTYPNEWKLEFNKLKLTSDIPLKFMTGLKILNVSHNELQEVNKNTFPKLYELHTIDFSHNNLSKIHSGIFGTLFGIRFLDLRYNNLTDLGGSSFGALPTLLELHLDHNKLKTVSAAAFSRLVSLRELTISHNKMKKIFQISGSLNDLNVSYNEIEKLTKVWPVMNALQRLDLSGNNLGGHLVGGSFENLGALSQIRLANNNISDIPHEALSDLRTVQYIDLSSNNISILQKAALGRLPIVFTLLLSNNNISTIEYKAFDGLLQLLHLDLSKNQIKYLPVGAFQSLVSLRTLNLSQNALQRTDNGTNCLFEDNLSLETLDLSSNKISAIFTHSFPEQRWTNYKLANINLSNNQLTVVSREFLRGTRSLKTLDLSFNKISEVKKNVLGNITTLETLDLTGNSINFLDSSNLGPPPNLNELVLKNNHLKKFPIDVLLKAPFKLIDLQGNRLKNFDLDFMPKIRNGSRIFFNNNPLACDCRLIIFQRYFKELRQELTNFTSDYFKDYEDFKCRPEKEKQDVEFLKNLTESQLNCDYSDDPLGNMVVIPENHDVEIRTFSQVGQNVEIRWRVKSKRDILGFKVIVVGDEEEDEILMSKTFGYGVRAAGIPLPKGAKLVCLIPNFSTHSVTDLLKNQNVQEMTKICQKLDVGAISASYSNNVMQTSVISVNLIYLILIGHALMRGFF